MLTLLNIDIILTTRLFQSHLLSVFDNIRYVTFEEKMYDKIVSIISQEGENVPLQEHVMAVVIDCFPNMLKFCGDGGT